MRKAAQEAEAMANTVAAANLTESSGAALQRNATDLANAVQAPAALATAPTANPRKRKSKAETANSPDANGAPAKPKKEKQPRDPNLPKRPASAYLLFQNDVRGKVKEARPELDAAAVRSELGSEWKNMSTEQRAVCDVPTNFVTDASC